MTKLKMKIKNVNIILIFMFLYDIINKKKLVITNLW